MANALVICLCLCSELQTDGADNFRSLLLKSLGEVVKKHNNLYEHHACIISVEVFVRQTGKIRA